jgi:hypothetical protein
MGFSKSDGANPVLTEKNCCEPIASGHLSEMPFTQQLAEDIHRSEQGR